MRRNSMKTKPRNPNPKIFNMTTFLTADDLQTTYSSQQFSLLYQLLTRSFNTVV